MNRSACSRLTVGLAFGLAGLPVALPAQTVPLQVGRMVAGTLAKGDTARYAVTAGDSAFVLLELNQISVAASVRIVDAAGKPVGRFAGPGRGASRWGGPIEKAGAYQVQVIPSDGQAGAYQLTLLRLEPVAKDPKRLADQLMAAYDGGGTPGGVVHVWRDGKVLFSKAYGMANLTYGIPYAVDTRTNIGSTSKQFTAFAIMLQAQRGRLSLDDDIRKHVPELPAFDRTITVRHLITHTSGLREFLNLLVMAGRRLDRGDWIDRRELIDIVQRQTKLQNEPGTEWNYNNTAFGLAALIVERTSGKDFPTFMREDVFEPLGMTRTMVRPSIHHMVPGGSEGYTPGPDGFLQVGDLGGAIGAGSIYTTVGDLQRWVENYAHPRLGTPAMIKEMMTSYVLKNGKETGYGYGLFIDKQRGLTRVHHGGADVAHRSMLAYYPEINAGVTVQSNHAGFNSGMANQLAAAFFADAMKPEVKAAPVAAAFDPKAFDPRSFDRYTGRYALDANPGMVLTFSRKGDSLFVQATGQPQASITPTSDSSFAVPIANVSATFLRNADGKVTGLNLAEGGQNRRASRLEGEVAKAWAPSAQDLAAFAGRYFSDELETFYTITLERDTLVVRQRRLDDAKLRPGEKDRFAGGGLSYEFERDRNGEVIGFYVANGRTRDVRFGRVR